MLVILNPGEMWKGLRKGNADAWAALLVTAMFFWALWLWCKKKRSER